MLIEVHLNYFLVWDPLTWFVASTTGLVFVLHTCPYGDHGGFVAALARRDEA